MTKYAPILGKTLGIGFWVIVLICSFIFPTFGYYVGIGLLAGMVLVSLFFGFIFVKAMVEEWLYSDEDHEIKDWEI